MGTVRERSLFPIFSFKIKVGNGGNGFLAAQHTLIQKTRNTDFGKQGIPYRYVHIYRSHRSLYIYLIEYRDKYREQNRERNRERFLKPFPWRQPCRHASPAPVTEPPDATSGNLAGQQKLSQTAGPHSTSQAATRPRTGTRPTDRPTTNEDDP